MGRRLAVMKLAGAAIVAVLLGIAATAARAPRHLSK